MKAKKWVTWGLLAFVVFSVAYLLVKDRTAPGGEPVDHQTETGRVVTAYYFYGNFRCDTCRKIESYTAESLRSAFTNELADGRLRWRTVNTDEPENEHFVNDYELTSRAVVLVDRQDGKQLDWKNLDDIWDLVGEKDVFQKYIVDETAQLLRKAQP